MSVSKKRLHTNEQCFILLLETNNASLWCYKRTTLPFGVTNEQRFPLVLQTNNAFRIVTQTYFSSDHTIDFCVVNCLHGIVRNHDKVYQASETSVSKKRLHTKRTTLHFFVRNEQRFPLL